MIERTASRTALFMAAYRARATREASPLCVDPFAAALAGEEGEALAARYDTVFGHMQLWTALRTAYIDARVQAAVSGTSHIRQIVILGAGFDTRAARLATKETRFFEVDHPDTQADKLERIDRLQAYPKGAAIHVGCDFEREDFVDRLVEKSFDLTKPALVVWEGVTPYLSEVAVRGTLTRLSETFHAESAVVFDHVMKKIVRGDVRDERDKESSAFVRSLGEPLLFGIDDALPLVYACGFRRFRSLSFDEICLDFTGTYDRERKFRFQSIVVASVGLRELP